MTVPLIEAHALTKRFGPFGSLLSRVNFGKLCRPLGQVSTTIRQPVRHIALTAVEALVRQLDGAPPDAYEVLIDPELIVRESTGPAPGKLRKERPAR